MRKVLFAALAVCALAGAVASADGAPTGPGREYVVLYEHGASGKAARAAIADAGGRVVSENAEIGVATVRTSDSSFAGDVAQSRRSSERRPTASSGTRRTTPPRSSATGSRRTSGASAARTARVTPARAPTRSPTASGTCR